MKFDQLPCVDFCKIKSIVNLQNRYIKYLLLQFFDS